MNSPHPQPAHREHRPVSIKVEVVNTANAGEHGAVDDAGLPARCRSVRGRCGYEAARRQP